VNTIASANISPRSAFPTCAQLDAGKAITRAAKRTAEYAQNFTDKIALCEALRALVLPSDAVLVKGSRGMKMEEIVAFLQTLSSGWKEKNNGCSITCLN